MVMQMYIRKSRQIYTKLILATISREGSSLVTGELRGIFVFICIEFFFTVRMYSCVTCASKNEF